MILPKVLSVCKEKGRKKHILLFLAGLQDNHPRVFPSLATIADEVGITERGVGDLIKYLEAREYLKIERVKQEGKRPRNYYTVLPKAYCTDDHRSTAQMITEENDAHIRARARVKDLKTQEKEKEEIQYPEEKIPALVTNILGIAPQSEFYKALCNGALTYPCGH